MNAELEKAEKQIADGGDRALDVLAQGVTAETNPPSWVGDESAWEKAKSAAGDKYGVGSEKFYRVVTYIYKNMGGTIKASEFTKKTRKRKSKIVEVLMGDSMKADAEAKWNKLFPVGLTKYRDDFPSGKIEFSKSFLSKMFDNFKKLLAKTGHEMQVNYHHLGGAGLSESAPLESTVAAGWIEDVELRDDGFYALMKWTDRAKSFIEKEELKYLSPEFAVEYQDRDSGKPQGPTLLGAALTNTPFLKELPGVEANDQPAEPIQGADKMDKAKLIEALGLPAEATDEDIMKELAALVELKKAEKEEPAVAADAVAKEEEAKKMSEVKASVLKLAEDNKKLAVEIATLRKAKNDGEIEIYLTEKVREGKVTPATREHFKKLAIAYGLDEIKPLCEAQVIVQMGELGVSGGEDRNETKVAQSKLDSRINELRKIDSSLNFTQAHDLALSEMPDVKVKLYSVTTNSTKALAK